MLQYSDASKKHHEESYAFIFMSKTIKSFLCGKVTSFISIFSTSKEDTMIRQTVRYKGNVRYARVLRSSNSRLVGI